MAIKIAPNGNSSGINDPNFLPFTDMQAGVLLPNCPGYPVWLPSFQLTLKGRLCFWNFPRWLYKTVVSVPANQGTTNYLRDAKKVVATVPTGFLAQVTGQTAVNLYPSIPADKLGTSGSENQYFWGACNTYFKITPEISSLMIETHIKVIWAMQTDMKMSYEDFRTAELNDKYMGWDQLAPGKFWTLYPWDWIWLNLQWTLNKFLNKPFDITGHVEYGKSWPQIFNIASGRGDLGNTDGSGWLNACNFWTMPGADPSTWDKVSGALPGAILTLVGGVLSFVTAGAATPLVALGLAQMNKAIKSSDAANAQAAAQQAFDSAQAGINMTAVNADIATATAPPPMDDNQKKFIFFAVIIIIVAIVLIIKSKSK